MNNIIDKNELINKLLRISNESFICLLVRIRSLAILNVIII